MTGVNFTEENIQKLFGHEAAEDEDPARLREYYFKVNAYDKVVGDFPLRILVGHKGIGKSALFKVAMSEDREKNDVAILVRPNEVANLGLDTSNFLQAIDNWSIGLSKIIIEKTLRAFGLSDIEKYVSRFSSYQDIMPFLEDVLGHLPLGESKASDERILTWLDNPQVKVYVDDLDRGWQGRLDDVKRISALLNAVRDISNRERNPGLSFKIALRSDVYYLVRTSDESTDKIEGSVIWLTWTNHEIFVLLIKRIETFFGRRVDEKLLLSRHQRDLAKYLNPIMEPRFTGRGHWAKAPMYRVLMSLIRKRPRDLVKLCTLAARHAYDRGGQRMETQDFEAVFEEYSQGRIQDTINEYRSELPAVERLIMGMRPNRKERQAKQGYVYKTADLLQKIRNIQENNTPFRFATGEVAGPKDLAAFMYKINFLTARKERDGKIVRKYFEENRYLQSKFVDFGFDWEVHPAYRWALQPESIDDIFTSVILSADE